MSGGPARRVLVVEDELAIRELLRLHLELAGFVLKKPATAAAPSKPREPAPSI